MKIRSRFAFVAAIALVFVFVGGSAVVADVGPQVFSSDSQTRIQFDQVNSETGFEYSSNREKQEGITRASVSVVDYDRNGYPDVLAVGGDNPSLFQNTGGEFKQSGQIPPIDETVKGALFFDYDNDGWEDLLLLTMLDTPIFFENDEGNYERRDVGLGNVNLSVPVSASAADFNADGCLDVFIAQNGAWAFEMPRKEIVAQSPRQMSERVTDIEVENDNGNENVLLQGNCDTGSFDVVDDAGLGATHWTTTASFVDLTGDGLPDIHAANDFNYDYLYVNRNGTSFDPVKLDGTNRHAMSSEVVDIDGDGRMDIFETNVKYRTESWTMDGIPSMDNSGNVVLLNRGDSFRSTGMNVTEGGWGWAAAVTDFDNDGQLDIVHSTKYYRNGSDRTDVVPTYPKVWARDDGTFRPKNASDLGLEPTDGRGLAVLDFDRDGDQDVVIANIDGEYALYENTGAQADWLQVAVRGTHDTPAVGTRLTITADDQQRHVVVNSRADLQSQDTRVSHIGLAGATSATIEATWPDGTTRRFSDVGTNQRVVIAPNGSIHTDSADLQRDKD